MRKKFITIIIVIVLIGIFVYIFINNKETKENDLDNTKPKIKLTKEVVKIDADSKFDPLDNLKVKYGSKGGNTSCDKSTLEIGENTITCTAKGNNNLTSEVSYKVIMSKTYKKRAIFFGDSIVYGLSSSPKGYSWANYIGDNYDLKTSINAGISDYRVSTYDDPKKWLVDEVKSHYNDKKDYDFVILQGGINDVFYYTPLGTISESKDPNSFDNRTFCGGLENYLYHATSKWPNARIGYIITYYTPNYTEYGHKWSYADYKKYYDITIKILDKWNIKYLNLATDEFNSILKVESREYLPDYLHLNNEGYKVISPYIYDFMQTLERYN